MKEIVWDKEAEMGSAYHEQDIRPELQGRKLMSIGGEGFDSEENFHLVPVTEELWEKVILGGVKKLNPMRELYWSPKRLPVQLWQIGPIDLLGTGFQIRVFSTS